MEQYVKSIKKEMDALKSSTFNQLDYLSNLIRVKPASSFEDSAGAGAGGTTKVFTIDDVKPLFETARELEQKLIQEIQDRMKKAPRLKRISPSTTEATQDSVQATGKYYSNYCSELQACLDRYLNAVNFDAGGGGGGGGGATTIAQPKSSSNQKPQPTKSEARKPPPQSTVAKQRVPPSKRPRKNVQRSKRAKTRHFFDDEVEEDDDDDEEEDDEDVDDIEEAEEVDDDEDIVDDGDGEDDDGEELGEEDTDDEEEEEEEEDDLLD